MKKLSKKVFLLPLCALIANPFSAAFAVGNVKGKSDHKHHSGANYEKKHTRKPKRTLVMTEKKIEGCCKSDDDKFVGTGTLDVERLVDNMKRAITDFKTDLLEFVLQYDHTRWFSDEEFESLEEIETWIFRDHHELKEVFDAQIAKYSDLLRGVNLSEGDRVCLHFIFTTFMTDISKDVLKYPQEERARPFVEKFTRRLMNSKEVRGVCDNYPYGNELLNSLSDVAHGLLDINPYLSLCSLFHCLRMLLVA